MTNLEQFMELLTGHFTNDDQVRENPEFPRAEHINTRCNDRIRNLPPQFAGEFLIEESYYTVNGTTRASAHLFLFTEQDDGILLTSYTLPEGYDSTTFTSASVSDMDYRTLRPSSRFTPALYRKQDEVWEGGSVSQFSPTVRFTLYERFSKQELQVEEILEVNGRRNFGYDQPICYRRVCESKRQ